MTTTPPESNDDHDTGDERFPRWLKYGILGVIAFVVIGYGLVFLYAKVINDSPDELTVADLAVALETETTAGATTDTAGEPAAELPTDDTQATEPPTSDEVATTDASISTDAVAGSPAWVVTDASELGYRVKEVLFGVDTEAVGRTSQITGSLTIEGTTVTSAAFEVDVASISSDESKRDNQFRGRIMSTDEFPTATFTLTEPIELGVDAVEGAVVESTATGELTLRGTTNNVTFDVTAQLQNARIGVLGNIPVVFADYGIDNPSAGGITTEDNGLLEFVLVFEMS